MPDQILLVTLQTFSTTGGIQKMTRTLGHSLYHIAKNQQAKFSLWSLYDAPSSLLTQYLPTENFIGFNKARLTFIFKTLLAARHTQHLVLSHINLGVVGVLVKLLNPTCKVYLIAHGIEVWRPLSKLQKLLLAKCTRILCVSAYTRQQIISRHQIANRRTTVLNNALDPCMPLPADFNKPAYLNERYQLNAHDQIIFTLTRLASTEQYKGYEQVIKAVAELKDDYPRLKYILAGPYDAVEYRRIQQLIQHYRAEQHMMVIGFVPDHELTDHFLLADLFVLPSKKEGFGLVFIEALACGLPVISGNADGSVDAIKHGELGQSVAPEDTEALKEAITRQLAEPLSFERRKALQHKCIAYFNELQYRHQLNQLLLHE